MLISCSIHHHIVGEICAHVCLAVATSGGWVDQDCLCSVWDEIAGYGVGEGGCCIDVTAADLGHVNWCPRH